MYTVTINNTYSGLKFKFYDLEEAMVFIGLVIEKGEYTNHDGETERPKATIDFEEV